MPQHHVQSVPYILTYLACCVGFKLKPRFAYDPATPKNAAHLKSGQKQPLKKCWFG